MSEDTPATEAQAKPQAKPEPETLPPIHRATAPRFVVLKRVNGHFENSGPIIESHQTLDEATASRKALASRHHGVRFALFSMLDEEVLLPVSVIGEVSAPDTAPTHTFSAEPKP